MKLIITYEITVEVKDLDEYDAENIAEAAEAQKNWLDDGDTDIKDLLSVSDQIKITVKGVK